MEDAELRPRQVIGARDLGRVDLEGARSGLDALRLAGQFEGLVRPVPVVDHGADGGIVGVALRVAGYGHHWEAALDARKAGDVAPPTTLQTLVY